MNYTESLDWVYGAKERGARKQGLTNMTELLRRLGNPEAPTPCVHVAGTNGKGSVCAYLDAMLRAAGYRTGLTTSPYLERFPERIRVDGQEIPEDDFAAMATEVRQAADAMVADGLVPPTFFELTTACAFLYFARERVDIAVIETGLGGRTDATNVVAPEVSVLAAIGMDHMHALGGSLEAIAAEKAGILKPVIPAVLAPGNDAAARAVVLADAARKGCPVLDGDGLEIVSLCDDLSGQRFSVTGNGMQWAELETTLLGPHQLRNAATALLAAQALRGRGWQLPDDALRRGLAAARWPGRMEVLRRFPAVLLDGAHNPQGAQVLADAVGRYFPGQPVVLVTAILADKDAEPMAAAFSRFATRVLTTQPPMLTARELTPPDRLAALFAQHGVPAEPCADWRDALDRALASGSVVVIAGSLYLAGAVRGYLLSRV